MKNVFLFLLFFISYLAHCQQTKITGHVTDNVGTPLQYVNVVLLTKNIGTVTDDKGFFSIAADNTDSIKFSHIAYLPRIIKTGDFVSDTITLKENLNKLTGVLIKGSTSKKKIRLGFYNKDRSSGFDFGPGNEIAVFLTNPVKKSLWIKFITFEVKQKGDYGSALRVRLLKKTEPMIPGEDLLTENYIIENQNLLKTNTIDISKSSVYLPPEGIFVVIEWMGFYQDKDKKSYPVLQANTSTKENLVWINYRDRRWVRPETFLLTKNGYITPNISLTVSY